MPYRVDPRKGAPQVHRDELAGATDTSGGWPTVAEGAMAPNTGDTAKGELLVVTAATYTSLSAVATAVVAMDLEAATAAAIGVKPSDVNMVDAANKRDTVCSSVPFSCPTPSKVRPAGAGLVADTDLAATARPGRWRQAGGRFRTGGPGGQRPVSLRVCGAH